MRFSCQKCGRAYAVSDELAGRSFKMKCKACGEVIVIRSGTTTAAPVQQPPPSAAAAQRSPA